MTSRRTPVLGVITATLVALVPAAANADERGAPGQTEPPVLALTWTACGQTAEATAAGVECAVADLPMDYDQPQGERVGIAVARVPATDPAQRIGSLFFNFGGPGGPA